MSILRRVVVCLFIAPQILAQGSIALFKPSPHPIAAALQQQSGARALAGGTAPSVLVIDSAHIDEALAARALHDTLGRGAWIVVLNASEELKRGKLHAATGTASAGGSAAYMVRHIDTGNGRIAIHAADLRHVVTANDAADYARQIAAMASDTEVTQRAKAFASGIPDGLLYKDYYFSSESVADLGPSLHEGGSQRTRLTMLAQMTVFLDNRRNPQGDFQWVAVRIDGQANPTDGGSRAADKERERAWMQSLISVSAVPSGIPSLAWVATAPTNPIAEKTYQTNASFEVGFSAADGPSGSYTWGTSNSYTLPEWGARSTSSGLRGDWGFGSLDPGKGFWTGDYTDCDAGWMRTCFFQSGLPNKPNDQVWSPIQFHTVQAWKTGSAVDTVMWVSATASQRLLDASCGSWSPGACWGGEYVRWNGTGTGNSYMINLGAVIPVPIQSLTFDPSPATAGQNVTATITLAKPAPTDVLIDIASNSQNAIVLPSVTVKQGSTSATFTIQTNANGIAPGGQTVAAINAFYAQNFVSTLTIKHP